VIDRKEFSELRRNLRTSLQERGLPALDLFGNIEEDLDTALSLSDQNALERAEQRAYGANIKAVAAEEEQSENALILRALANALRAEKLALDADNSLQVSIETLANASDDDKARLQQEVDEKRATAAQLRTAATEAREVYTREVEVLENQYREASEEEGQAGAITIMGSIDSSVDTTIVQGRHIQRESDIGANLTDEEVEARQQAEQEHEKIRDGWKSMDYEMVYDRLQFDNRGRTCVTTELLFEITEVNGHVRRLRVVPDAHYGYVAHAIYSGLEADELKFRNAVDRLGRALDQLSLHLPKLSMVLTTGRDVVAAPWLKYTELADWLMARKGAHARRYEGWRVNVKKMQTALSELNVMCGYETGPSWPPPELINPPPLPSAPLPVVTHVRTMPQLVQPLKMRLPRFQSVVDAAEPDEWARPYVGNTTWRTWVVGLLLGLLGGGATGAVRGTITRFTSLAENATYLPGWVRTAGNVFSGFGSATGAALGGAGLIAAWFIGATAAPLTLAGVGVAAAAGASVGGWTGYFGGVAGGLIYGWRVVDNVSYLQGAYSAVRNGLPAVWTITKMIVDQSRRRDELKNKRLEAFKKAVRLARGIPVLSALANARVAMERLDKLGNEFKRLVWEGQRYYLTQKYVSTDDAATIQGRPLLTDDDWTRVPCSNVLSLSPPADVLNAIYEAEVLRRVRARPAIGVVVGSVIDNTVNHSITMAASEANNECVTALSASRSPLQPVHLFASAAQRARQLAVDGGGLILAAYGTKEDSNAVHGGDLMWSCLPGGAAARLALRHLSAFDQIETRRRLLRRAVDKSRKFIDTDALEIATAARDRSLREYETANDEVKTLIQAGSTDEEVQRARDALRASTESYRKALAVVEEAKVAMNATPAAKRLQAAVDDLVNYTNEEWSGVQRAQVDAFVDAWRSEAREADRREMKALKTLQDPISAENTAMVMNRSAMRMRALSLEGSTLLVATASPRLVSAVLKDNYYASRVMSSAMVVNSDFTIDARLLLASSLPIPESILTAFWASRCVDMSFITSLRNLDPGGNDLAAQLASLSVDAYRNDGPVHYYCPVGASLSTAPTTVPFETHVLNSTPVNCNTLARTLLRMRQSLVPLDGSSRANAIIVERSSKPRGLEYHPLVVTALSNTIRVFEAEVVIVPYTLPADTPRTLLDALKMVARPVDGTVGMWARSVTQSARAVAFNTDRYKHAVALAIHRKPTPNVIILPVRWSGTVASTVATALAIAIGLTLYEMESGRSAPAVALEVDGDAVEEIGIVLERLSEVCRQAVVEKCGIVYLNELCHALVLRVGGR
jgi:hypothetical protein